MSVMFTLKVTKYYTLKTVFRPIKQKNWKQHDENNWESSGQLFKAGYYKEYHCILDYTRMHYIGISTETAAVN